RPSLVPKRARRDRADRRPEQERRDEARDREHYAPVSLRLVAVPAPPAPPGPPVAPERERGAAQHDPDQDERQRDVEQRPEPREGRREAREQQDDREDEPHVVRLPHGADRLRDQVALTLPAGTAREQVPHAAPEVRAPTHG